MNEISRHKKNLTCSLCLENFPLDQLQPLATVRDSLFKKIIQKNPELKFTFHNKYICLKDLNQARKDYFKQLVLEERGDLTEVENAVVKALAEHEVVSKQLNDNSTLAITFGERLSDKIASFGGSWTFILSFGFAIMIWVLWNTNSNSRFDPYPFILLNLFLSCLASLQAPIIMMSQNRLQEQDRIKQEQDFKVNLKSEVEIRVLNEKIDKLISHQWQRLLEIQEMQMDFMEQLTKK